MGTYWFQLMYVERLCPVLTTYISYRDVSYPVFGMNIIFFLSFKISNFFLVKPDAEEKCFLERDHNAQDDAYDIKLCGITPEEVMGEFIRNVNSLNMGNTIV